MSLRATTCKDMPSPCQFDKSSASLPSGWVEDFLIEFYLEGSGAPSACAVTELDNEHAERVCTDGPMTLQHGHEERSFADGATDSQDEHEARLSVDGGNQSKDGHVSDAADAEIPAKSWNPKDICKPSHEQSEIPEEDERMLEVWQAQYGQVVRSNEQAEACPPAISLWNWTTVLSKGKCKNKTSVCLLGQLAQTSSRLHDSLQHGNGLIKTAHVCEVNLDLVKVTSGEIFKLQQPSSKYLSSVTLYDSSNPTKDWGFPCIEFSGFEAKLETASMLTPKVSVTKPFRPNWNHQRYHQYKDVKVASLVPAGLRVLSEGERASLEERRRKYKDRAKERRECYGHDEEYSIHKKKKELNERAVGKHMLERMGLCEGEVVGNRKYGWIKPIDAQGNCGRAGIGWCSSQDHDGKGHHG